MSFIHYNIVEMQMILLYKDPKGNSVFERRQSAITTTCTGEKASILQAKSDLEKQVATLQKALTERDVTIAELKRDNMTENKTLVRDNKINNVKKSLLMLRVEGQKTVTLSI